MSFSVHDLYPLIFRVWRTRRLRWFREIMRPTPSDVLLDVGGWPGFWLSEPQMVARIDSLNLDAAEWNAAEHPGRNVQVMVGDGCALSFENGSYDIVFSNSVIEHVGSWERQVAFAAEVRRVGRSLWVQTPAWECPIEPHYLGLFIHWLPAAWQRRLIRWTSLRGLLDRLDQKTVDELVATTRLLTRREMKTLFPDCTIMTERLLGMIPKSYIAYRPKPVT